MGGHHGQGQIFGGESAERRTGQGDSQVSDALNPGNLRMEGLAGTRGAALPHEVFWSHRNDCFGLCEEPRIYRIPSQAVRTEKRMHKLMNAVVFDRMPMILFGPDPIPDRARSELLDEMGGRVVEDVEVEVPDDISDWPRGAERPQNVLAVARDNPRHFAAFKYQREMDPARYEPAGMSYAVVSSWEGFLKAYRPLDKISRITDESDRPGLDEEVMRSLTGSAL